jgi:hypothetical protein
MRRREFIAGFAGAAAWPVGAADIPKIAFLGFQLINTSPEPTTAAEEQRIKMLNDLFQQEIDASGRLHLESVPDAVRQEIESGPNITNCNGCQRDYARKIGADWAAWGTVQKVSNLILNINVYLEDERSGTMRFAKSVDIRGNTDDSWRRGLTYLLRNYLLSG